jgi:hypothetical protein
MTKHAVLTRTTLIIALAVSLFAFGSCTKHVTQVVDQGFSAIYTIHPSDWKVVNDGLNYYRVDLSVPEVTDQIVQHGGVDVYLSFDANSPVNYEQLPEDVGGYIYTAGHTTNTVSIGYRSANGTTPNLPSGDIFAKVVILDATPL